MTEAKCNRPIAGPPEIRPQLCSAPKRLTQSEATTNNRQKSKQSPNAEAMVNDLWSAPKLIPSRSRKNVVILNCYLPIVLPKQFNPKEHDYLLTTPVNASSTRCRPKSTPLTIGNYRFE
ncbi:MAG TPA: hypothetical protein EYN66_07715 [Myxococcales bacterium]|nr:hypothetical protein [Myxococcales bacterium]